MYDRACPKHALILTIREDYDLDCPAGHTIQTERPRHRPNLRCQNGWLVVHVESGEVVGRGWPDRAELLPGFAERQPWGLRLRWHAA